MPRSLHDQVIVITGASSGIGRETAIRAGRSGAAVVLSARNEAALREAVEQIEREGGHALAIVADVAEFNQVDRMARQVVDHFGRIDTWVNNAAITLYGTVEQITPEEYDRVMRVNYLGTVHGTKAALPHMMRQNGGTIINIASVESERAFPLQSAYTASKHAIKGFTEAIRMELKRNRTGIDVVQINPASINTPFFDHGRSKTGSRPMPMPPIYDPALVAEAILECASCPPRLVNVGGAGAMIAAMQRLSPSMVDSYMMTNDRAFAGQMTGQPDNGIDNFDRPMDPSTYQSRGAFGDQSKHSDFYTRAFELHPGLGLAVLGGIAVGAVALAAALSPPGRRAIGSAGRGVGDAWDRASHAADRGARDAASWASRRAGKAAGRASHVADRAVRAADRSARAAAHRIW